MLALGPHATACFDADGTIWRGDVGEDFLRELIAKERLIAPPPGDLYAQYEAMVPVDAVRESWLVEDRWWTDRPLRRRYWEVVTTDGRDVVVFRELDAGGWFAQRA